jgi:transcriptional regulator of acetoin/glycerol metabolism
MTVRDKTPPPPFQFTSIGRAVMESFPEGIVVFDSYGRAIFANREAQRVTGIREMGDERADHMLPRLASLGARILPLKTGDDDAGVAAFIPPRADGPRTLAERERQAILDTLEATHGKLAETARRLGISRTTLWRRLKSYGMRPEHDGHWQARSA